MGFFTNDEVEVLKEENRKLHYEITYLGDKLAELSKEQLEFDEFELPSQFASSKQMMKDFIDSVMWKDMQSMIKAKLRGLRDDLETTGEHNDIIHIQGEIYSMRTMLALPELVLKYIENEETEDSDERH